MNRPEFLKVYRTRSQNAVRTLEKKVQLSTLLEKVQSPALRTALANLIPYGRLNFWDFGARASSHLLVGSSVQIICGTTLYRGSAIQKIGDPTGELGDLFGWARQFKAPWKNICALDISESARMGSDELSTLLYEAKLLSAGFYAWQPTTRKVEALTEGHVHELSLTSFERNPAARRACLDHYGAACQVCGLDFGLVYGALGEGFIHVHHVTPLAISRGAHMVDPIKDLVPVCPNCHAMLHINQGEVLTIEFLRSIITTNKNRLA